MEITIYMACSINGFIAGVDGNEDFLSHRNYEVMLEFLEQQDVLIWGRKTFDNVISWGENYLRDLKNTNVIILSKTSNKTIDSPNIVFCQSLQECISHCKKNNYKKLFVSGGAIINNLFMENGIVDKIILNYNPYIMNSGIPLFSGKYFQNKLKLNKVVNEQEGIIQIHYEVIK